MKKRERTEMNCSLYQYTAVTWEPGSEFCQLTLTIYEVETAITSFSQKEELTIREVKGIFQGHTGGIGFELRSA
jgi:hypothetical protein